MAKYKNLAFLNEIWEIALKIVNPELRVEIH